MPSVVRVGFVVGAEIVDEPVVLLRNPCEMVPTARGDLPVFPSLSYGTACSLSSAETWRGRGFLRPKRVSMEAER